MRASTKKWMGFILIQAIVLLVTGNPLYAQEENTVTTVNGIVKDARTKKRLEYVNVAVAGTNIGTVTNTDGEFSLKVTHEVEATAIEISHIGYRRATLRIESFNGDKQEILLTPIQNLLDEIVVRAQDPRFLVEEAMKKIRDNYSPTSTMLTGFYRETAQKGRGYINISEAIIDVYKTPYDHNVDKDRVQILKGRTLLSQKRGDTLVVKLLGGPTLSVYVDVVKNPDLLLDPDVLPYYSFRMEESVMIDNRPQYVVAFHPQAILPFALYYGRLYIDKENLAFTRAEFNLDMDDTNKATQAILKKKPFGLRFKPQEVSFLVTYTQRGERTYLSYIRNQVRFKCDWKRKLFSTNYTILSEMVVTDGKEETSGGIPFKAAFKASQSFTDRVSDFMDEDFWGNYNIIEPTESLESAVNKLRKQKR
ncbi:MAG: carboxypeptidase-like regulatory domain-containing protein [Tannerellaceae bacterium]|nr:carboxypeptidase-like regulatory domain-containing protein [Tannerellaceae bacterium]